MSDPENRPLTDRLHRLGERPVDGDLAGRHLTAMTTLPRPERASRFHRAKVAAAFATGLVLGGTSLASAGALGDGAQRAVADTVDGVGVDLPGGTPRSTHGCEGREVRNHGQFVSGDGDPRSDCGKPVASLGEKPEAKLDDGGESPATPACRPPWAGRGNAAEKTAEAKAAHHAACGEDSGVDDADGPVTDGDEEKGTEAAKGEGNEKEKSAADGAAKESEPEQPDATVAVPPATDEPASPSTDHDVIPPPTGDPDEPAVEVVPPSEPATEPEPDTATD